MAQERNSKKRKREEVIEEGSNNREIGEVSRPNDLFNFLREAKEAGRHFSALEIKPYLDNQGIDKKALFTRTSSHKNVFHYMTFASCDSDFDSLFRQLLSLKKNYHSSGEDPLLSSLGKEQRILTPLQYAILYENYDYAFLIIEEIYRRRKFQNLQDVIKWMMSYRFDDLTDPPKQKEFLIKMAFFLLEKFSSHKEIQKEQIEYQIFILIFNNFELKNIYTSDGFAILCRMISFLEPTLCLYFLEKLKLERLTQFNKEVISCCEVIYQNGDNALLYSIFHAKNKIFVQAIIRFFLKPPLDLSNEINKSGNNIFHKIFISRFSAIRKYMMDEVITQLPQDRIKKLLLSEDSIGNTPLALAFKRGNPGESPSKSKEPDWESLMSCIRRIVSLFPEICKKPLDREKNTLLMFALSAHHSMRDVLSEILYYSDINHKNMWGETAEWIAKKVGVDLGKYKQDFSPKIPVYYVKRETFREMEEKWKKELEEEKNKEKDLEREIKNVKEKYNSRQTESRNKVNAYRLENEKLKEENENLKESDIQKSEKIEAFEKKIADLKEGYKRQLQGQKETAECQFRKLSDKSEQQKKTIATLNVQLKTKEGEIGTLKQRETTLICGVEEESKLNNQLTEQIKKMQEKLKNQEKREENLKNKQNVELQEKDKEIEKLKKELQEAKKNLEDQEKMQQEMELVKNRWKGKSALSNSSISPISRGSNYSPTVFKPSDEGSKKSVKKELSESKKKAQNPSTGEPQLKEFHPKIATDGIKNMNFSTRYLKMPEIVCAEKKTPEKKARRRQSIRTPNSSKTKKTKLSEQAKSDIGHWGETFVFYALKSHYKQKEKYSALRVEDTQYGFRFLNANEGVVKELHWYNIQEESYKELDMEMTSYKDEKEQKRYLEVKTTRSTRETFARFSMKECAYMTAHLAEYRIFRVFNAGTHNAKMKKIKGADFMQSIMNGAIQTEIRPKI